MLFDTENHGGSSVPSHAAKDKDELRELTTALVAASTAVSDYLEKQNLPPLSSDQLKLDGALSTENADSAPFHIARRSLIEAAQRMVSLASGPRNVLMNLSFDHCATACLQVIVRLKLAHLVPLQGASTYENIAGAVQPNISPALIERFIGHAMSFGVFRLTDDGRVAHSPVSALLVTDPDLEAWLYLCTNVAYPAGAAIPKAMEQYGESSEADESAFSASIGRKVSQFARFREADGHEFHEMFAKAMRGAAADGDVDFKHTVDGGFPWHDFEAGEPALIVDVGGGPGHVSVALARRYPKLTFEVQDLPETVKVAERNCPEELKERIRFRAHDFFEPQPTTSGVEKPRVVYIARFILHDWADKYAAKILGALAKSLRPQDRIVLNENIVPKPGEVSPLVERRLRDLDLLMLMNLNGRERTLDAFKALCDSTTPRLQVNRVHKPPFGRMSLIDIGLAGAQTDL